MPTPDPPENGPPAPRPEPVPEPGTGSGPHAQPWTWSVDPDPPSREPTPDPEGGPTVDEPLPPPPVTPPGHDSPPLTGPTGAGSPPATGVDDAGTANRPPDWSTPDTPAVGPPIGGGPFPPHPDQPSPDPARWPAGQPPDQWPTDQPPPGEWPTDQPEPEQRYADRPESGWTDPEAPGRGHPVSWLDEPAPDPDPYPPRVDRGRRLWLVLGVSVALVLCCCAGVVGTALTWGGDLYAEVENRGQRIIGLNQAGRDGDLEFQVRQVRCGVGQVGDPLVSQAAVGQFCLVELAVRNVGKRPAFFTDALQRAYGPDGELFNADSEASMLANADQQVFLNEINPGNLVTGALVYDIPIRARIVRLRLHHAPSSPGLVVRVE